MHAMLYGLSPSNVRLFIRYFIEIKSGGFKRYVPRIYTEMCVTAKHIHKSHKHMKQLIV